MTLYGWPRPDRMKVRITNIYGPGEEPCEGNCKYKYFYDRSLWCSSCLFEYQERAEEIGDELIFKVENLEEQLSYAETEEQDLNDNLTIVQEDIKRLEQVVEKIHDLSR